MKSICLEAIEMIQQGTSLLLSKGLFFTILLQLMSTPVMGRDKTDVVILKNGDHVTGEIKSLEQGKMSLSISSSPVFGVAACSLEPNTYDPAQFDRVLENFEQTSTLRLEGPDWDNTLV
jgi:hypothetical protein